MKKALLSILALLAFCNYSSYAQCGPNEIEVTVEITTDQYGYETYWALLDSNGDTLLLGGEEPDGSGITYANNTTYTESVCVSNNQCLR
ncbi:MAG: hypothetical protein ACPGU4_08500, partial [Flavobacteriales bacterium]